MTGKTLIQEIELKGYNKVVQHCLLYTSDAADDNAGLADIAPTLLQLLNLPIPREMTGKSLIQEIELKGYNKVVQHV